MKPIRKSPKRLLIPLLAALCLSAAGAALLPPSARGSVVQALSLEQLVQRADHVVLAVAEEKQSRPHQDGRLIVTDFSLRVQQTLKGDSAVGGVLIATCLGGKLEKIALQVPGEASFALGARHLVFLRKLPDGQLRVVGMSQGVMPVSELEQTPMVLPGGGQAALVERDADSGQLEPAKPALSAPTPLESLLAQIRALVAAAGAR